jgi:hypothetical protein
MNNSQKKFEELMTGIVGGYSYQLIKDHVGLDQLSAGLE